MHANNGDEGASASAGAPSALSDDDKLAATVEKAFEGKPPYSVATMAEAQFEFTKQEHDSDLTYCKAYATFHHDAACEYIMTTSGYEGILEAMKTWGCSQKFMDIYERAAREGHHYVLFYY